MNWMVLPNQVCLIVKLYNNRPELLPDSNEEIIKIWIYLRPQNNYYGRIIWNYLTRDSLRK